MGNTGGRLAPMNAVLEASLHFQDMPSPVGRLRLIASDTALVGIWFEQGRDAARGRGDLIERSSPVLEGPLSQLEEDFATQRRAFYRRWSRAAPSSSGACGSG